MSVSPAERKAALDLFPYFNQNHPIVFDVGSNKGVWADIFVHNVAEMHLFEPNEILLHYTMAKYDYLDNIHYNNYAVGEIFGKAILTVFEKNHNGLSSLLDNSKWIDLPHHKIEVDAIPLDAWVHDDIDFVKLDIEGYEYFALMGMRYSLMNKLIKFIQIERADHIHYAGKTFQDIIDYLKQFGYTPLKSDDIENVIFAMEGFTQNWNKEFIKNTQGLRFDFALEIGCFEGLTSRYICDNLLNTGGRVICVDPLTNEYLPDHEDNHMFVGQYERFTRNTRNYPIELIRKKSSEAFHDLKDYRFDFIYIDGDHREDSVYMDGVRSFQVLKVGGYILFDDYEWREETKRGIDRFLSEIPKHRMEVVLRGYQVMIKKLQNIE